MKTIDEHIQKDQEEFRTLFAQELGISLKDAKAILGRDQSSVNQKILALQAKQERF